MIFEQNGDLSRCKKTVQNILASNHINVTDDVLEKITRDIMGISYAKGGGYSGDIIASFARGYIAKGLHKKYTDA